MIYIVIGILGTILWIAYEIKRAPFYDEKTGKFYKDYDTYKHNSSKQTDGQTPDSGAQRNKESAKRSKKTKGS